MERTIDAILKHRIDTTSNWNLSSIILYDGEEAFERTSDGFVLSKVGDGVHIWRELPYQKSGALNLLDGKSVGSLRGVDTTPESADYIIGVDAVALGNKTEARGKYAFAEGYTSVANGLAAHAEGRETLASGNLSHAEGFRTTAAGMNSHAGGYGTIASGDNQTVIGKYNINDLTNTYAFIIGNGGSDSMRSNALTIKWTGEVEANGKTLATEEFVLNNGGKIDGIKVNGILQSITNKIVNISVPTKTSQLTNDSGYLTEHQSLDGLENTSFKVASIDDTTLNNTYYPTTIAVANYIAVKAVLARTETTTYAQAYVKDKNGSQTVMNIDVNVSDSSIPIRGTGGVVNVGEPKAETNATTKGYVDGALSKKADTTAVTEAIGAHNSAADAHSDLRLSITNISNRLNTLADSDDTTLDQMSEVVAYIKNNKTLIDSITTTKLNVADVINNLTTNVSNKALSAAQGVVLKGLIDKKSPIDHNHDEKYLTIDKAYVHPIFSTVNMGFYKVRTDASGHIVEVQDVAKTDITKLGIPGQDTTYEVVTQTTNGLMSAEDKIKLDSLGGENPTETDYGNYIITFNSVQDTLDILYRGGN